MEPQELEVYLVGTRAVGGGFRVTSSALEITDRPYGVGELVAEFTFHGNEKASRSGTTVTIHRLREIVVTVDAASEPAADELSKVINSLGQQAPVTATRCIVCQSNFVIVNRERMDDRHCPQCDALLLSTRGVLLYDSQQPDLDDYSRNMARDRLGRRLSFWAGKWGFRQLVRRASGYGEGIRNLAMSRKEFEIVAITDHRILYSKYDEDWPYSRILEATPYRFLDLRGISIRVVDNQRKHKELTFRNIAPKERFEEMLPFIQARVEIFRDAAGIEERKARERELQDAERIVTAREARRFADGERGHGEDHPTWEQLRQAVLERDAYRCSNCGANGPDVILEGHHIVPREAGGSDTLSNLVTLCRDCHVRAVNFRG